MFAQKRLFTTAANSSRRLFNIQTARQQFVTPLVQQFNEKQTKQILKNATSIEQVRHFSTTQARRFEATRIVCQAAKEEKSNSSSSQQEQQTAQEDISNAPGSQAIRIWLLTIGGLVFAIVIVGGLTRLTESGLSMVEWRPLGHLPPITKEEWEKEFANYKQFPEYKRKNMGMSVEEFKFIYYYEYIHRMIGRVIGAAFVIPAAIFWRRGLFSGAMKRRVALITSMIGFQGFLGWYMVHSGLDEEHELMKKYNNVPRVSQYRLAAHLSAAFVIYATVLWSYFDYLGPIKVAKDLSAEQLTGLLKYLKRLRHSAPLTTALIFTTAMSGAFVAGMDAGLIYNEFPLMGGKLMPPLRDMFSLDPKIVNFFENATTVQFQHRFLATLTATAVTALYIVARRTPVWKVLPRQTRLAINLLGIALCVQYTLGFTTLLYYVPVELASAHQTGSLTLFTIALWLTNQLKRLPK